MKEDVHESHKTRDTDCSEETGVMTVEQITATLLADYYWKYPKVTRNGKEWPANGRYISHRVTGIKDQQWEWLRDQVETAFARHFPVGEIIISEGIVTVVADLDHFNTPQ